MLRYAIKKRLGHQQEVPKQKYNGLPVPEPPQKGDIDMIIAGFPWYVAMRSSESIWVFTDLCSQTHSGLNMFKHANDPKSSLIFNALSYVDEYRPKMVYFENVHGFLTYALNATQASVHRLEGGVPMGGLKIVVRALLDLGYQVRFCLLQAAHYGTPQTRVRFVLMGALDGLPLPNLPQPTHYFPETNNLPIDLGGEIIRPIKAKNGAALHPFVTIDDAIDDLPWFDWYVHDIINKLAIDPWIGNILKHTLYQHQSGENSLSENRAYAHLFATPHSVHFADMTDTQVTATDQ